MYMRNEPGRLFVAQPFPNDINLFRLIFHCLLLHTSNVLSRTQASVLVVERTSTSLIDAHQ